MRGIYTTPFFLLGDWALPEEEITIDCSMLAADLPRCHPVRLRYRHVDLIEKKKKV